MRRLLALALSLFPALSSAQEMTEIDWQLLAIDGVFFDAKATLRIGRDGVISGRAPCNSWSTMTRATLPDLSIRGIRATRMACDKLAEEQAFFDRLADMTAARIEGGRNLVLTGPDGHSLEFVADPMNSLTVCVTCPPGE
jgi:heat shock protein HslJ